MINNSVSYSHSDQNFTFLESFENLYFKQNSSTKPIIGKPQKLGSYQITANSTKTGRQACDFTYENEKFNPIPRKKIKKIDEKVSKLDFSSNDRTRPPRNFETKKDLNYPFPVKYLKNQINLSQGFQHFIPKIEENLPKGYPTGLKTLLQWKEKTELSKNQTNVEFDFITWRGILQRIISGFITCKGKHKTPDLFGAVRMENSKTVHLFLLPVKEKHDQPEPEFLSHLSYMGRSFEKLILNSTSLTENQPIVINENDESVNVYQNKIGNYRVIYGAEMDGIDYELKTTKEIYNSEVETEFLMNFQKWWAQCFLVDIDRIVVGFRSICKNRDFDVNKSENRANPKKVGIVHKIADLSVKKTAKISMSRGLWKWETGIVGLQRFLKLVEERLKFEGESENEQDSKTDKLHIFQMDYETEVVKYWFTGLQVETLHF